MRFLSRRTVNTITVIVAGILITVLTLFILSYRSIDQAKKETVALIELDYPIQETHRFYWLTTPDETYFSLEFSTDEDTEMYGIITRNGGEAHYYSEYDIINHDDAIAITVSEFPEANVRQARLGLLHDDPVWEVTFLTPEDSMTYYYLNAQTGKWIETISNF